MLIPHSRQNSKSFGGHNAKTIGNDIAMRGPVFENLIAQEGQRCAANGDKMRNSCKVALCINRAPEPRVSGFIEKDVNKLFGGVHRHDCDEKCKERKFIVSSKAYLSASRIDDQSFHHFGIALSPGQSRRGC